MISAFRGAGIGMQLYGLYRIVLQMVISVSEQSIASGFKAEDQGPKAESPVHCQSLENAAVHTGWGHFRQLLVSHKNESVQILKPVQKSKNAEDKQTNEMSSKVICSSALTTTLPCGNVLHSCSTAPRPRS